MSLSITPHFNFRQEEIQPLEKELMEQESSDLVKLPQEIFEQILLHVSFQDILCLELSKKNFIIRTEFYLKLVKSDGIDVDWTTQKVMTPRDKCILTLALHKYLTNPKPEKFAWLASQYPPFGAYIHSGVKEFEEEEKRLRTHPITAGDFLLQGLFFVRDFTEYKDPMLKEKISDSMTTAICRNARFASLLLNQVAYRDDLGELAETLIFVADFTSELFQDFRGFNDLSISSSKISPQIKALLTRNRPKAFSILRAQGIRNYETGNWDDAHEQLYKARELCGDQDGELQTLQLIMDIETRSKRKRV